jgi:hypothetical protein
MTLRACWWGCFRRCGSFHGRGVGRWIEIYYTLIICVVLFVRIRVCGRQSTIFISWLLLLGLLACAACDVLVEKRAVRVMASSLQKSEGTFVIITAPSPKFDLNNSF